MKVIFDFINTPGIALFLFLMEIIVLLNGVIICVRNKGRILPLRSIHIAMLSLSIGLWALLDFMILCGSGTNEIIAFSRFTRMSNSFIVYNILNNIGD